jgi:tetratricopeptide (TPR) repeat protein
LEHSGVAGVRFSKDQQLAFTWDLTPVFPRGKKSRGRLWSVRPGEEAEPLAELDRFALDPGGQWVLNWQVDNTASGTPLSTGIWDSETGKWIFGPAGPESIDLTAILSRDKRRVLTWGDDGTARIRDSRTGYVSSAPMVHFVAPAPLVSTGPLLTARFSPDQYRVMTWRGGGSGDASVRFWDSQTGAPLSPDPSTYAPPVLGSMTVLDDGNLVLTWRSGDRTVLGAGKVADLIADLDFPVENLLLRLEAQTGLSVTDVGYLVQLSPREWDVRWAKYEQLAREHLRRCRYPRSNWYLHRMMHRPGSCEGPGDWLDLVNPEILPAVKEMYAAVCLERGRQLLAENRYGEARTRFDSVLNLEPRNAAACEGLARSLIDGGEDPSLGVEYAVRSLELNPHQAPDQASAVLFKGYQETGRVVEAAKTALGLAEAYVRWQKYRPAVEAYQYAAPILLDHLESTGRADEVAEVALGVAGAYGRLYEHEQALEAYLLAVRLGPGLKEQLDSGALGRAMNGLISRLKSGEDPGKVTALFDRVLRAGLADAGRSAVWANQLAYHLIEHDVDVERGIAYANQSLELDSSQPLRLATDTLARGYIKQGGYDEAITLVREMLDQATDWKDRSTLERTLRRAEAEKKKTNSKSAQ